MRNDYRREIRFSCLEAARLTSSEGLSTVTRIAHQKAYSRCHTPTKVGLRPRLLHLECESIPTWQKAPMQNQEGPSFGICRYTSQRCGENCTTKESRRYSPSVMIERWPFFMETTAVSPGGVRLTRRLDWLCINSLRGSESE